MNVFAGLVIRAQKQHPLETPNRILFSNTVIVPVDCACFKVEQYGFRANTLQNSLRMQISVTRVLRIGPKFMLDSTYYLHGTNMNLGPAK